MKTLLLILATVSLSAAEATLESRPEPSAWRFAHPDAQILAGADLFRLGQSPLGEKLRQQFLAAMGPELSRHVQRLLVSTAFLPTGSADSILILSGPLDPARIKQMAARGRATIKNYKGVEVILPPGGSPEDTHFAIVDSQTALLGNRAGVTSSIDRGAKRSERPLAQQSPLFSRALDLTTQAEVWVLSEELPSGLAPAAWERQPGGPATGIELVLKVQSPEVGLALGFAIEDPTATDSFVKILEAERFGSQPRPYVLGSWLAKMALDRREGGLVLSQSLSEPAVLEEFPLMAAALGLPVKPAKPQPKLEVPVLAQKPVETTQTAPPPQLAVRIEGLEGGPVEIPYQSKK